MRRSVVGLEIEFVGISFPTLQLPARSSRFTLVQPGLGIPEMRSAAIASLVTGRGLDGSGVVLWFRSTKRMGNGPEDQQRTRCRREGDSQVIDLFSYSQLTSQTIDF